MQSLLDEVKKRRLDLGLKQRDLVPLVGMSRQQYQRLESKGNPRLSTLEQIAKGLNCELLLVPDEKFEAVMKVMNSDDIARLISSKPIVSIESEELVKIKKPNEPVKKRKKTLPEEPSRQRSFWDD